jgi:hypothetical protein
MENFYSAYVRTVNGNMFYFVKKYQVFPEYKDVPPILDTYAMHSDFEKACKIAMICDRAVQQRLINELGLNKAYTNAKEARPAKARIYKLKTGQINFPSILRLGWLTKI